MRQISSSLRRGMLTVAVASGLLLPAWAVSGAPAHWSERVVNQLRARGLMVSASAADEPITRAEVARLLVGAVGLAGDAQDLRLQPSRFYDVSFGEPGSYVELAAEVGVMRGYGGGIFGPDDPLTRAQLVAVLVRALGWDNRARVAATQELPFQDSGDVPAWAHGYVAVASQEKLVLGYEDGTFRPNQPVSRSDAAALIARFMEGRGELFQRAGEVDGPPVNGRLRIAGEALTLAPNLAVYRNGETIAAASLRAGERVQAILNDAGQVNYLEVVIPSIAGSLVSIDPSNRQIHVRAADGAESTLTLATTARIFRNGQAVPLTSLRAPDDLYGLLDAAGEVQSLDATHIDFEGVLVDTQRSGGTRLVAVGVSGFLEVPVSPRLVVYLNGQPARMADLRPSDHVKLGRDDAGAVNYLEATR